MTRRTAILLAPTAAQAQTKREELCFLPATELAQLLRRKQISSRELLEAHLRRIRLPALPPAWLDRLPV